MKFWEALKALDEGNEVEYKSDFLNWNEAQPFTDSMQISTVYEMNRFDFRLKPKPREFWVNIYPMTVAHVLYSSREEAALNDRVRCIRLREVIE